MLDLPTAQSASTPSAKSSGLMVALYMLNGATAHPFSLIQLVRALLSCDLIQNGL